MGNGDDYTQNQNALTDYQRVHKIKAIKLFFVQLKTEMDRYTWMPGLLLTSSSDVCWVGVVWTRVPGQLSAVTCPVPSIPPSPDTGRPPRVSTPHLRIYISMLDIYYLHCTPISTLCCNFYNYNYFFVFQRYEQLKVYWPYLVASVYNSATF